MKLRLLIGLSVAIGLCHSSEAQTVVRPEAKITNTSFAVITDTPTYNACAADINAFADVLAGEGLPTFVVYNDWKNPEQVKKVIDRLYKKDRLEGVMFVGDIPIPMIRKAQHLTSAFKMDETYPMDQSSVPSDRFYDDMHLKFDFIKQDSVNPLFFYYELAIESPQQIKCDIYSARVKPIDNGEAPAAQISKFFRKAIAEHKAQNSLDQFFSYTGEGSYSNSLAAWVAEGQTLREQMPGAFDSPVKPGRARFLRYNFSPYPKEDVINMLRREDLDMTIFHEHGVPERQYLSGIPETEGADDHVAVLREGIRSLMRRAEADPERFERYKKTYLEKGVDSTWWAGYNDPEVIKQDSLSDLRRGIVLSDVTEFAPNSRFVIFDACYNGDFRENDNIASRYIFSDGKCVSTFANSVNVLQDKMADEMFGLLWLGARIGQWAQETNILESHILGDPTMKFVSADPDVDAAAICSRPYSEKETLALLDSPYMDIRNLALHRLWRHNYKNLSPILAETYLTSPFAMERYTAFSLLNKISDATYQNILPEAIDDSYEFIRRKAANWMGRVGKDEYVPVLIQAYYDDNQSARVAFNITSVIEGFTPEAVEKALAGRDDVLANNIRQSMAKAVDSNETIFDRNGKKTYRKLYAKSLRNDNNHAALDKYIALIEDPTEDEDVRINMINALAWYESSYRRGDIKAACDRILKSKDSSKALKEEAKRTYYRLK